MTTEEKAQGQINQYLLKGAPKPWATEEIEDFLKQQNWKHIERITRARYKPEWRFHGQAPISTQDDYHFG